MSGRTILVAIAAASVGIVAGMLIERHGDRLMASPARPPAQPKYRLATAAEFTAWLGNRSSQSLEPILDPFDLPAALYPCGETPSPCSVQRDDLSKTIAQLRAHPKAIRDIAYCMSDGCEGAMAKLKANACLWWTAYVTEFKADKGAVDDARADAACKGANLGEEARSKALVQQWSNQLRALFARNG